MSQASKLFKSSFVDVLQGYSQLFESFSYRFNHEHFLSQLGNALFVFFDTPLFHVAQMIDFCLASRELLSKLLQHEVEILLF